MVQSHGKWFWWFTLVNLWVVMVFHGDPRTFVVNKCCFSSKQTTNMGAHGYRMNHQEWWQQFVLVRLTKVSHWPVKKRFRMMNSGEFPTFPWNPALPSERSQQPGSFDRHHWPFHHQLIITISTHKATIHEYKPSLLTLSSHRFHRRPID